jgi:hypothetical protein
MIAIGVDILLQAAERLHVKIGVLRRCQREVEERIGFLDRNIVKDSPRRVYTGARGARNCVEGYAGALCLEEIGEPQGLGYLAPIGMKIPLQLALMAVP